MKTADITLARRYAKAYVGDASDAQARLESLEKCRAVLAGAMEFVSHPLVPAAEKIAVIRQVLGGKFGAAEGLLEVLVKGKRFSLIDVIIKESSNLVEERQGRARARVRSAVKLDEPGLERLRKELERLTGKKITAEVEVSPELIGGLEVKIGDMILDYTIKSRLRNLRKELLNFH